MLKYSPLDAEHRAIDARMTPFGGWDMPLQYAGGTLSNIWRVVTTQWSLMSRI